LLDEYDNIRIGDFGFARWMPSNIADTSCGSPNYAAPEVVRGIPYDGRCADIWSCGVILYALLAGKLPFEDPSLRTLLAKVKCGKYKMPTFIPSPIQDLIGQMLCVDVRRRISIEQIKRHRAFRAGMPPDYAVPSPVFATTLGQPIPEDAIDAGIFGLLEDIGYESKDAILAELTAPGHSLAKVFYMAYRKETSVETLAWPSDAGSDPKCSPSSDVFETSPADPGRVSPDGSSDGFEASPGQGPEGKVGGDGSGFRGRVRIDESLSEPSFQLAKRASWAPSIVGQVYAVFETLENVQAPLESVMAVIQRVLVMNGYEYIHPNQLRIWARNRESGSYACLDVEQRGAKALAVVHSVPGNGKPDARLATAIADAVREVGAMGDDEPVSPGRSP
jgi:serine/threonine protein kinase